MPYDPKRLKEDRTPPPAKPAPRGTPLYGGSGVMAWRDGHCIQCGKPYVAGEQIIVNRAAASGLASASDGYHVHCWEAINGKAAERPLSR